MRGGSAITVFTHMSAMMSDEEVAAAAVTVEMKRRLATSHGIYGEHHSSAVLSHHLLMLPSFPAAPSSTDAAF